MHLGVGQTKEVRFSGAEVATRRIMYFYFTLRSFVISSLSVGHSQRHVGVHQKTLVLVVRHYSGGGSSHVEWTAQIRLHYPLFVLQMTISPVCFSTLK